LSSLKWQALALPPQQGLPLLAQQDVPSRDEQAFAFLAWQQLLAGFVSLLSW
jgi:hypothetical protein